MPVFAGAAILFDWTAAVSLLYFTKTAALLAFFVSNDS